LDSRSQLVHFGFLTKNRDMTALLGLYSPQVIAIDAPLSLPLGLCCLDEGCPCHPKSFRRNRQCDRELRRQGIPRYPTIKKTFIKDLIYRGIELKTSISREVKQAGKVIEVYPLASKVRLFGTTIPRKTTRQGMGFLREKLGDILPALRPYLDMFDHDLADIAVAAYTALLYHQNGAEALGR
jgi:predicted nuclease with RNAse H fold